MSDFVHLHNHTEYSLLDGVCRLKELVKTAKNLGQKAVAITDHGVMFGVIDFYKYAVEQGIKPIIGCEVYVARRTLFDKVHGLDNRPYHLILLCKNQTGYQNLIKMISIANTEGFYGKPRIDRELLEKYHEGLIALSACLAGEVPQKLLNNDINGAKQSALWYKEVFGAENYYIEIQDHGIAEQKEVLPKLIELSQATGIELVATNDVHYIKKSDSKTQKVLICIQTGKTVNEKNDVLDFNSDEFYLKSSDEMYKLFGNIAPKALQNTVAIADMCNLSFEFGKTKLPEFRIDRDHYEFLRSMCYDGLYKYYSDHPDQKIIDRLEYELNTIKKMGYVDYYLIVWDFINFARSKGIPVGPGRGSGAGSLAAYCIGITGIDPIKYNLIFERFLNPERVSMPDFDIDFCYIRRHEVVDYLVEKYGVDHVAQIVTFGTLAARAAIRDVGRALDIPYSVVDNFAKKIPRELGVTLEKALEKSDELKADIEQDDRLKELIDTAMAVEGLPRHASTHAAGVVITKDTVDTYVPLAKSDDGVVTQFPMTTLEQLGLLKIDLLGLRNLTIIDDAQKSIRKLKPDFDIDKIPLDDKSVFDMFGKAQTEGVFQFESAGMKRVLFGLKPRSIEDLIAVIALFRPGPMKSIPTYIENRHTPENIKYKTPLLKDILDVTYGCLIYQEQVMQVFRKLAGYSFGKADVVRRAMSKKKHDVMEKERVTFINGCRKNGVDEKTANEIFDEISSFASYAFNKSHAAAYATLSYRIAYLKCHYPKEYMAALLTSVLGDSAKVARYITECNRLSISVEPPDVNKSHKDFTVENGKIRFGLLAIKNLGTAIIDKIIDEREKSGNYTDFYSFCKRLHSRELNKKGIESLVKSGSLDSLGHKRRQMINSTDDVLNSLINNIRNNVEGQIGLFESAGEEEYRLPDSAEFQKSELLQMEKETTGIFISGHPCSFALKYFDSLNITKLSDFDDNEISNDKKVNVIGIVINKKLRFTRSGEQMAHITINDPFGEVEVIVFPKTLLMYGGLLNEGRVIYISGRVSSRDEREAQIVAEKICDAPTDDKSAEEIQKVPLKQTGPEKPKSVSKYAGLHILLPSKDCEVAHRVFSILSIFNGTVPVYIKYADTGKRVLVSQNQFVSLDDTMINELRNLLGGENLCILN